MPEFFSYKLGALPTPGLTPNVPAGTGIKDVFKSAVRTMQGKGMPREELAPLSDSELAAIYLYLHSLTTQPAAN